MVRAECDLGGNRYYIENPIQIINIPQGGLHIFGGLLLGGLALLYYLRQNNLDPWLFLDAAGPGMLIGQAIGRIANFINQELYGPPTTLPWGIPISAEHRLPQYANLPASTRFHPTFAYEMIWNILAASFLLWLSRRYQDKLKPGALFSAWLIAAGFWRGWLEIFFRPDQPKIAGTPISYSAVVSFSMVIVGVIMLLVRYNKLHLKFAENWENEYDVAGTPVADVKKSQAAKEVKPAKKTVSTGRESTLRKKAREKIAERNAAKKSS